MSETAPLADGRASDYRRVDAAARPAVKLSDRFLAQWIALSAGAFFALLCTALFRFTAEDAFIVQRYASQLLRGHGLVFNVGERVSALTSPLHALLIAGLLLLTPSAMAVYKAAGAAVVLAVVLYAGRRLFDDVWERALFFSATLGSPFVALWSVGGLETPLLLACVTALVVIALRTSESRSTSQSFLFFTLAALAFLLRHDSSVFVAPLAIAMVARNWQRSVPGVVAAALATAAWLLFAFVYYGDVFPASFYAKAVENRRPFVGGVGYELSFAVICLLPLALVRRSTWRGLSAAPWASVVLFGMLAAAVAGAHMMFGYRFFVPVLPALVAYYMRLSSPVGRLHRWGFVAPLAVNVVMFVVVYSGTVNPTIFHPSLFAPHYGLVYRLSKWGFEYEYPYERASVYGDFIDALRHTGRAVLADAEARGISRSARIATIIAGATATEIPDLYVYDSNLVGVRRNCPTLDRPAIYSAADYIEVMAPRQGSVARQLGTLKDAAIRISDAEFEFDGVRQHVFAYFNPGATHTPVPSRLRDPCPPGRP